MRLMNREFTEEDRAELYKELAAAVIWQAAYDYKENEKKLANAKFAITATFAEGDMHRIEEFFNSQRFKLFSEIDGRLMFALIKRAQGNPFRKKIKEA